MPRDRIQIVELARLFNSADRPVYILDGDLTIVFFNKALRQWLGEAADDLIGRQCAYHSQGEVTGPDAAAAGLCPPPDVLGSSGATANVSFSPPDGAMQSRRARFITLGGGEDDSIGVVAIVDADGEAGPPDASPPSAAREPGAAELHEQIRRFRAQAIVPAFRAGRLIGRSPAICRVRRQVELAIGSRYSAQIVGPAGSGRRYMAGVIHYGIDPLSAGSLVPLDCSIMDAELIGTTIAALSTGDPLSAVNARRTLLLEQADRLHSDVQSLLTSLLTGKPFPLRLLATTERDLSELARRGAFHGELASLLSTMTIELPPLSARREDLPLLAQAFLEELNAEGAKQIAGFSTEAMELIDAYPWPGNLDELAEAVTEAHHRAGRRVIGADDLPERLHFAAGAAAHPRRAEETVVLDDFLQGIERELIRRAVAQAKGNKAKAARMLGLTRPKLYRRMVQLGLAEDGEKEKD